MSSQASSCFFLSTSLCHGCGRNNWKSIAHSDDEMAAPDSSLSFCSTSWYSLFIAYDTSSSLISFLRNFHIWLRNSDPLSSFCFPNLLLSSELIKSSTTHDLINLSKYPPCSSSYIVLYIISAVAIVVRSHAVPALLFSVSILLVIGVFALGNRVVAFPTTLPS